MKKLICAVAVSAMFMMPSVAKADNVGCGLGGVVLKGHNGVGWDLLATFLNSLSGNQTFGISSGTSGCIHGSTISGGSGKIAELIDQNMDQFAMDAAKGQGETIDAIAEILNVPADKVGAVAKANFSAIFSEDADAVVLSDRLVSLLEV